MEKNVSQIIYMKIMVNIEIQKSYHSKSAHLSTTSTVMFSDEKSKFYVAASTVEAHTIRYPERSHFSRLKKKICSSFNLFKFP